MAVGDSLDALDIKKNDAPLFPKIIYYPPGKPRSEWFDSILPTTEDSDLINDVAHAVCMMPTGMPIETYDFSPFELLYVPKYQMRERFDVFCVINNRCLWKPGWRISIDVMKIIWRYFRYTSNCGYTLRM